MLQACAYHAHAMLISFNNYLPYKWRVIKKKWEIKTTEDIPPPQWNLGCRPPSDARTIFFIRRDEVDEPNEDNREKR
jgi:hypothetical protein